MKNPDSIIIGAGIIGMMTALELAQSGLSVLLIERGIAGKESSWAGGGILSPLYPWRAPEQLQDMIRYSQGRYPVLAQSLLDDTGIDPEWQQCGMLLFDINDSNDAAQWAKRNDYRFEVYTAGSLQSIEPAVSNRSEGKAICLPDVAQVRNTRLIQALRAKLEQLGVDLLENCTVNRLKIDDSRSLTVDTDTKTYSSPVVVLCNGAWASKLLPEMDIRPVRGQMLCYRTIPNFLTRILLKNGIYIIPRKDGHILIGSTMEEAGFDKSTTDEARKQLSDTGEELLPGVNRYPIIGHWSGLRPATESGLPYICQHPGISGLYLNTGHYRNGILLAPGSARLLGDMVFGRKLGEGTRFFRYMF